MKAKTMKILDKRNADQDLFGVKIQINNRRSVYVSLRGENHLFCVLTQKEAQDQADLINKYISENPDLETKLKTNKSIQGVIF